MHYERINLQHEILTKTKRSNLKGTRIKFLSLSVQTIYFSLYMYNKIQSVDVKLNGVHLIHGGIKRRYIKVFLETFY